MKMIMAVGISWYHKDDYARVKKVMVDGHVLPASYKKWLTQATALEQQIQASGRLAVRACIDPDEFPRWCRTKGMWPNAKARIQFANEAAYAQVRQHSA